MQEYLKQYERWLASDQLSETERAELRSIRDNDDEIRFRFSQYLSFGTAGLRGTMKVGMNAMNVHTVAYATQALAELIREEGRCADGVAIAYDSRNNSELFAKTAASVLAAHFLPKLASGELSRILFLATGAMMSPDSVKQGESIPAVAHLVELVGGF